MAETIYATSTGAPPAAIAIVRVSGLEAFAVGRALAGTLPNPRQAVLRALRDSRDGSILDRALVLVFSAPHTATGEDIVEFHVHGGRAVVSAVEAAIARCPGTRLAEAGEFTRRALENGVIDLTAAEGLGDLLSAQSETQRRAALRMAEGGVRGLIEGWTDRLLDVAARVEAQLDFSDVDDVPSEDASAIQTALVLLANEMTAIVTAPAVERLHEGIRVVIAGPPNSGKSTLLNTLTGRDMAIVSPVSGTTRDRIEAPVLRDGIAYVLTDTAGLTDAPGDIVEAMGVARTQDTVAMADIVLWLGDGVPPEDRFVSVHARADMSARSITPKHSHLAISAETGKGIDHLWAFLAERASTVLPIEDGISVNLRQRGLVALGANHIRAAIGQTDLLVVAEELRACRLVFDRIVGRAGVEDMLSQIFRKLCIGK